MPIPTIEEMYQQYLKLVNLKEANMIDAQRIETKRAFFGAIGMMLVTERDQIALLPDMEAVYALDKIWDEVSSFYAKEIIVGFLPKN